MSEPGPLHGRACSAAHHPRVAAARVDVLTAQEDENHRTPDPELLRRARELGRMLFSQDEDLIIEAVRCQRAAEPFATVIYSRQLDLSIGRCIDELETLSKAALPEDASGQLIFL